MITRGNILNIVEGFSKFSKEQKLRWIAESFSGSAQNHILNLKNFWHLNEDEQKIFDDFSENTISNHYMPYGVAPNFLINGITYCIPMVIEESSVVAAAASSAKFWLTRGGIKAEVISTSKVGQIHFFWNGQAGKLQSFFESHRQQLVDSVSLLTENMEARGGGIRNMILIDKRDQLEGYYQIKVSFETCDAMGANFINSVLESMAAAFKDMIADDEQFCESEKEIDILMSILSNYAPDSRVRAEVECEIEELGEIGEMSADLFAARFAKAIKIAKIDHNRAVTHNKGIFNGIDAVVLATGNDFRAIEACGHSYAARNGRYEGLTEISLVDGKFKFSLELPLTLGTVGGLTSLHPTAKASLELLGQPDAKRLMEIVASVGLATNFAAVRSLVTTGIQKGHMKMHLLNICKQLGATKTEIESSKKYFATKAVTFRAVQDYIGSQRMVH